MSLFLAAYAGGYWALRKSEVFSFEYPIKFLDGTLGIKNVNPTLTRNNRNGYDPIAEVRGWSVTPLPIDPNEELLRTRMVKFFAPAILIESRFQKNVVTDDNEHISGELSGHICGAALRALLLKDTGMDYPTLKFGKGRYWHHKADEWGVSVDGSLTGIDSTDLIRRLKENSSFVTKELKTEQDFKNYGGSLGFTSLPVYHFGHQRNDDEYFESWLLIETADGVTIRYRNFYTDS